MYEDYRYDDFNVIISFPPSSPIVSYCTCYDNTKVTS